MNKKSSVKSFGILFFLVFLIVGLWPLLNDKDIRIWSVVLSVLFLLLGLTKSKILIPLNNYWIKLGEILGKIVAPIVMLVVFLGVVTPMAFLVKLFGKDLLNLKFNKKTNSYWLHRQKKIGPMKNQF
tara:strand:- start:782 stop:1162 length:381 start_codon:yes stop_codon:yes gene_type:complete